MEVAWMNLTRPDAAYEVASAAQVTEEQFQDNPVLFIDELNSVISQIKADPKLRIIFPALNYKTAYLCVTR
jgi:hypothetical protein